MSKKRTRLSNEEKAVGMTLEDKKAGVTIAYLKKNPKPVEEVFVPIEEETVKPPVIELIEEEEFVAFTDGKEPLKIQEELNEIHEANRPTGLGDVVEAITTATGVKALVKFFTPEGEDCGCDARKEKLNALHLRGKEADCLLEDEFNFFYDFFTVRNPNEVNASEAQRFREIYSRVMRINLSAMGSCDGCMRDIITELKAIYETYE